MLLKRNILGRSFLFGCLKFLHSILGYSVNFYRCKRAFQKKYAMVLKQNKTKQNTAGTNISLCLVIEIINCLLFESKPNTNSRPTYKQTSQTNYAFGKNWFLNSSHTWDFHQPKFLLVFFWWVGGNKSKKESENFLIHFPMRFKKASSDYHPQPELGITYVSLSFIYGWMKWGGGGGLSVFNIFSSVYSIPFTTIYEFINRSEDNNKQIAFDR